DSACSEDRRYDGPASGATAATWPRPVVRSDAEDNLPVPSRALSGSLTLVNVETGTKKAHGHRMPVGHGGVHRSKAHRIFPLSGSLSVLVPPCPLSFWIRSVKASARSCRSLSSPSVRLLRAIIFPSGRIISSSMAHWSVVVTFLGASSLP